MNNEMNPDFKNSYIRKDGAELKMSDEDNQLAQKYAQWPEKGAVADGRRVTIMAKKKSYAIDEEVRIIHVLEATGSGHKLYVMGPKKVFDEYLNSKLQGKTSDAASKQQDPFKPLSYDGRVMESPAIDDNYEITSYTFKKPGVYEIYWKPGNWTSNVLKIEVKQN